MPAGRGLGEAARNIKGKINHSSPLNLHKNRFQCGARKARTAHRISGKDITPIDELSRTGVRSCYPVVTKFSFASGASEWNHSPLQFSALSAPPPANQKANGRDPVGPTSDWV